MLVVFRQTSCFQPKKEEAERAAVAGATFYAFTELGVAILSSFLNSERGVQTNIVIMRAFVRLREVLVSHKAIARKMQQLEATQKDYSGLFTIVFQDFEHLKKHYSRHQKAETTRAPAQAHIGCYNDEK